MEGSQTRQHCECPLIFTSILAGDTVLIYIAIPYTHIYFPGNLVGKLDRERSGSSEICHVEPLVQTQRRKGLAEIRDGSKTR